MTQSPMIRQTQFVVSCLPEDNPNRDLFTVTVEYRGRGGWAVARLGRVLSVDGDWEYEPSPSNRDDEWLAAHRFPEPEALRRAVEVAPNLKINGYSVADALNNQEDL